MNEAFFEVDWPGRLVFGPGKLASLGDKVEPLGSRVFLVTTRDLSALGVTGRVQQLLEAAGLAVTLFEDVHPDPTCVTVDAAARLALSSGCDLVVGLGGGSAIDLAKGVAVAATHEGPVWDYVTYTGANARPVTPATWPVIAIPTTAGTGSEVTRGTVLDNPERHMKAALLSEYVYPRLALVDPELTYTMPEAVTAMTGFDALTHGMEAYLNAARANPASDLFALEAVRRVVRCLPPVLANPGDREARAEMSWAATLGGISIALSNTTVAHAMGLPLGARCGTAHGLGLSRLLPVVFDRSWRAQSRRFAVLAEATGAARAGMTEAQRAQALGGWMTRFVAEIGLAGLWSAEGIDSALLDVLTDDVFSYMGRPVQQHLPVFNRQEMREMFQEALLGP